MPRGDTLIPIEAIEGRRLEVGVFTTYHPHADAAESSATPRSKCCPLYRAPQHTSPHAIEVLTSIIARSLDRAALVDSLRVYQAAEPLPHHVPTHWSQAAMPPRCLLPEPVPNCNRYTSQHGEDRVLLPLLMHITGGRPGVFVELGALDGQTYSNTVALEQCLGWRGVLIEADADNFAKLARGRRSATAVHAAVCDRSTGTFPISAKGPTWARGSLQDMTPEHRDRFRLGEGARVRFVPCKPLDELMRAAAYDGADFLSLDVEGAELHVLQNANLSAFRVMMVEMGGDDPQKEARIESLLLDAGFWLAYHLLLGPEKAGGRNKVFVDRSLSNQMPYLRPFGEPSHGKLGTCLKATQLVVGPGGNASQDPPPPRGRRIWRIVANNINSN